MRAVNILAGAAIAALALGGTAVAAPTPDKTTEILQNIELSDSLTTQILALGACASEEAVLGLIEAAAEDAELTQLAAALELVEAAQDWCPSVRAALSAAIEAAHLALAVRVNDATGAGADSGAGNHILILGGYGPNWGSGGSGYTY
jgi:hypothetical protein